MNKSDFNIWRARMLKMLDRINIATKSELTGIRFYQLEYRGRSHHLVLTCDNDIVARGMYAIENTIIMLCIFYNGKEGLK